MFDFAILKSGTRHMRSAQFLIPSKVLQLSLHEDKRLLFVVYKRVFS